MNYTHMNLFGRVYRVDQRNPYRRRRFVLRLALAFVASVAFGLGVSAIMPTAEPCEINEPRCYDESNIGDFQP